MDYQHATILFLLILIFVNLLENLKRLNREVEFELEERPLVSVLIPARNEEKNIQNCLISFIRQTYTNLEIIVLDDNSSDNTYEIARNISKHNKNIRVFKGKKLPLDWTGKNWACHQLSLKAKGKWLLFTDADTIHQPHSVLKAVCAAVKNESDFLSCLPRLIAKTWSEKLYMSIIHFVFAALIPWKMTNFNHKTKFPFGMGPFMLIRKKTYWEFGGYEAQKKAILDDMGLARLVKENDGAITILDGTDFVQLRYYENFRQLWNGFSKNSFDAVGDSLPFSLIICLVCYFLFVFPYFSLWSALESNQSIMIPAVEVALISLIKVLLALHFESNLIFSLLHPLSVLLALSILLNSVRLCLFNKGVEWKERYYPIK